MDENTPCRFQIFCHTFFNCVCSKRKTSAEKERGWAHQTTVGCEQPNGHGTDEPDDDGFILVSGRKKYKAERGYGAVAPVPVNMIGNKWTGKKMPVNKESKNVLKLILLKQSH